MKDNLETGKIIINQATDLGVNLCHAEWHRKHVKGIEAGEL